MDATTHCPACAHGTLAHGEGKLDQSGDTYLPTTRWACDTCGYVRYDPAVRMRWRAHEVGPDAEAGAAAPDRRRAA